MSVAVSPYLISSQALQFQQHEQQSDLLEALLASCQKSAMNPRLPGYGRSLQPYFVAEARVESPQVNVAKGKGKQRKNPKGRGSNASSSDEDTSSTLSKGPAKPSVKAPTAVDVHQGQTIKAIHKHQYLGPASGSTWAGPAFGMAPAASEIPLPSDFLLV